MIFVVVAFLFFFGGGGGGGGGGGATDRQIDRQLYKKMKLKICELVLK